MSTSPRASGFGRRSLSVVIIPSKITSGPSHVDQAVLGDGRAVDQDARLVEVRQDLMAVACVIVRFLRRRHLAWLVSEHEWRPASLLYALRVNVKDRLRPDRPWRARGPMMSDRLKEGREKAAVDASRNEEMSADVAEGGDLDRSQPGSRETGSEERSGGRGVLGKAMAHPVLASLALAATLHLVWLFLIANSGGDLAAQDAWAEFARQHPGSAYNLAWYGGMHPVSYSVISPYLMAAVGVRTTIWRSWARSPQGCWR
ncbi:hypothetical protein RB200_35430 [Streptomyces sp. PmtG]